MACFRPRWVRHWRQPPFEQSKAWALRLHVACLSSAQQAMSVQHGMSMGRICSQSLCNQSKMPFNYIKRLLPAVVSVPAYYAVDSLSNYPHVHVQAATAHIASTLPVGSVRSQRPPPAYTSTPDLTRWSAPSNEMSPSCICPYLCLFTSVDNCRDCDYDYLPASPCPCPCPCPCPPPDTTLPSL